MFETRWSGQLRCAMARVGTVCTSAARLPYSFPQLELHHLVRGDRDSLRQGNLHTVFPTLHFYMFVASAPTPTLFEIIDVPCFVLDGCAAAYSIICFTWSSTWFTLPLAGFGVFRVQLQVLRMFWERAQPDKSSVVIQASQESNEYHPCHFRVPFTHIRIRKNWSPSALTAPNTNTDAPPS